MVIVAEASRHKRQVVRLALANGLEELDQSVWLRLCPGKAGPFHAKKSYDEHTPKPQPKTHAFMPKCMQLNLEARECDDVGVTTQQSLDISISASNFVN